MRTIVAWDGRRIAADRANGWKAAPNGHFQPLAAIYP
jgi:hypothetical protein